MNNPLVSVIIAAYNADKFIEDSIKSVLNQTMSDFEIIVVNDGSTDKTKQIVEKIEDKRIRLINQTNKGQDAAFNRGFKESKGKFIKFFDADDLLSSDMLEEQTNAINKKRDYIAYSQYARFYNNNLQGLIPKDFPCSKDSTPIDFLTSDFAAPMLQCGMILMHRSLIEKAGLWNEDLILFNDTEFFFRVILKSKGVLFTEKAILFYRSGVNTSITSQNGRKYFESTQYAIQLIEKELFKIEYSKRTCLLIANMYQMRVYTMYPNFIDISKHHVQKINELGGSNYKIKGSRLYNVFTFLLGWKITKRLQIFFKKS